MSTLSVLRISYKFTICFTIKLWFANLVRITLKSLSFARKHNEFTIFYYLFRRITIDSVSASRFHYEYTICFANLLWIHFLFCEILWIHYLFCDFTTNSLSLPRIRNQITISVISQQWIHYLLRDFTLKTLFLREICMNSLSASRFPIEFTFFFANSLFSRIYFECTIFFGNSLSTHDLFREITVNSLSASQFLYWIQISNSRNH